MKKLPVRIMHVFGSLNIGGAESRIMDVFRKVDKKLVAFHFVSLDMSQNQFFEEEIKHRNGVVHKIPSPRLIGFYKHFNDLVKLFKENNRDGTLIVHSHTLHHSGVVMLAAKLAKVKIRISHSRSTNSQNNNSFKSKFIVEIGRVLISFFATEMLAITEETANFLYLKKHIKKKRVKLIPNAIELDKYKKIAVNDLIKLKEEFNIKNDYTVIGHVGRFEKMKNHKFLIKLFSNYVKKNTKSILILIGDGSLRKEIELMVIQLGLKDSVLFLGTRNDVHLWMNIFDIVIMPSIFEGLPGLVSESQAAGTPCILSDNITKKSDLGLGLVSYLSLKDEMKKWLLEIDKSLKQVKPTFKQIESRFDEKNLSLSKEIKLLYKIYKV